MNIKVLGTGCAKCHKLEELVQEVVKEMDLDTSVEKVDDMKQIIRYPILMTPGLVINDELVASGKVPSKADITQFITSALAKE